MKKILVSVMTAMLLITAGCDKNQPPDNSPVDDPKKPAVTTPAQNPDKKDENTTKVEKPSMPENGVKSMQVTVYYPDQAGMSLVAVKREIKFENESQKYIEAVNCLMDTPEEDLTKIFPKGAKIKSINLKGDIAVVDLDGSITKNFVGGSTGEEFLINSVVETLTEFNEVKQVQFLIDGHEVETLAGHMDLSEPLKRE